MKSARGKKGTEPAEKDAAKKNESPDKEKPVIRRTNTPKKEPGNSGDAKNNDAEEKVEVGRENDKKPATKPINEKNNKTDEAVVSKTEDLTAGEKTKSKQGKDNEGKDSTTTEKVSGGKGKDQTKSAEKSPAKVEKVSNNLGAFMASFFTRQREIEKTPAPSDVEKSSTPTGESDISKTSQSASNDESSKKKQMEAPPKKKQTEETPKDKPQIPKSKDNTRENLLNVENKKQHSIGSLLAGLGGHKQEPVNSDTHALSGKSEISKVNQYATKEVTPQEKQINKTPDEKEPEKPPTEKFKAPKSRDLTRVEDGANVENKKRHSLGSLLAGLGDRRQEFNSSSDGQTLSGKSETFERNMPPPNEETPKEKQIEEAPKKVTGEIPKKNAQDPKSRGMLKEDKANVENKKRHSLGSLLAGLGGRKQEPASVDKPTVSEKSEVSLMTLRPADEESKRNDQNARTEEYQKEKPKFPKSRDLTNTDNSNSAESKKMQSLGSLLAGLGGRKQESVNSDRHSSSEKSEVTLMTQQPADKESKRNDYNSRTEESHKEKPKFPKSRDLTNTDNSNNAESKKMQSLGSLLAGLGGRKQESTNSDRHSSSEKSEVTLMTQQPADEESKRNDHNSRTEESQKEKPKFPKSRDLTNTDNSNNAESKKMQSLGSLLAGLGGRKQESMKSDRHSSSGRNEFIEAKPFPASDENKNIKDTQVKSKVPKPRDTMMEDRANVESKKSQSLGSILAGLGGRKQEFMSSDKQASSERRDVSQANRFSVDQNDVNKSNVDGSGTNRTFVAKSRDAVSTGGSDNNVESKKRQSLGSILSGLGSRKQEFQSFDQQPSSFGSRKQEFQSFDKQSSFLGSRKQEFQSSDKQSSSDSTVDDMKSDGGRMSNRTRGFGDFGFVSDKFQRNKKRTLESSEENENTNERSGKIKKIETVVLDDDGNNDDGSYIHIKGHVPKPKPTEKDLENKKKSIEGNMTFEEEAERRKTHCLGSLLSNLANRSFPDPPPPSSNNRFSEDRDRQWNRGREEKDFRRGRSDDHGDRRDRRNDYGDRQGRHDDYNDDRDKQRGNDDKRKGDGDKAQNEPSTSKKKSKKDKEPFDPEKAAELVKSETERLEKEHGPGVFSVGFTENKALGFICEICSVQLNKSTIDVHADGMQHLKKKNLWEKKKRLQSTNKEEKGGYSGGRRGWVKVENESSSSPATPSPAPITSSGDGSYGYDSTYGQGGYGYNNPSYTTPLGASAYMDRSVGPYGASVGPYGAGLMNTPHVDYSGHISAAIPPPPPPATEAPAKPKNAKGGATVSLLQRLDACAVKNEKDMDLAFNVVSSLLKSLKEFNHKRGDTKVIEVLTEMDIRFRSLKPKSQKTKEVSNPATSNVKSSKSPSGYSVQESSSAPNYKNPVKENSAGTWYSQGKGYPSESSDVQGLQKSTGSYGSGITGYAQQPGKHVPGTNGPTGSYNTSSYYSSGYSQQTDVSSKPMDSKKYSQEKSKDSVGGYCTQTPTAPQPGYQAGNSVVELIRSGNEPPPPPPPESNSTQNYAGYNTSYPPMGYYNLSAPPPNFNMPQY